MKKVFFLLATFFAIHNFSAQSVIRMGNYKGSIEINGKLSTVETKLEMSQNRVVGSYLYGNFSGVFTNSKLENHVLACEWVESENSRGFFRAIFNDDYSEFIAVWTYANGKNGGSWSGYRK